jgi:hypothetical protein
MSSQLRAVKVNELRLCHVCMKHPANEECWEKNQPDYEGFSEQECRMDHHVMLHWGIFVTALDKLPLMEDVPALDELVEDVPAL